MKNNQEFEQFFSTIYQDRWESLKVAMCAKEQKVLRKTWAQFSDNHDIDWLYGCRWIKDGENIDTDSNYEKLKNTYTMDPASIIAARSLKINPGDNVLDMCAAPGGKSLIMFENLYPNLIILPGNNFGELIANDPSPDRSRRLKKVFDDYIPKEIRDRVKVKSYDGIKFGIHAPEKFDAILVDAPCSSERHLLHSKKEISTWSKKRTKILAQKQYGLLCSALLALKPKGSLVYSTCSISPLENDGVIEKLIEKKGDSFTLDQVMLDIPGIEKTKFGNIFLPDNAGFGPIYFTRIVKN